MRLHIVYKCVYDLLQQVTEVSEVRKYHAQVFGKQLVMLHYASL